MQLNKYLAYAGISSRRKAVELIKQGLVSINNWVIHEPGHIVKSTDAVRVNKKLIEPQHFVYLILNKPVGYITSTYDEKNRPTVLDLLIDTKIKQKIYPVGRLDYDSSGLVLLTNDGNLAQGLSHPRYEIPKTYIVTLDRSYEGKHTYELLNGIMLEDGKASLDTLEILNQVRTRIKVTLHSGKNRIIRRIFDKIGYSVIRLDRVGYGNLSKKELPIGCWRSLTSREIKSLNEYQKSKANTLNRS